MKYFVADAFTDRLFGGNPAGVCVLDAPLDPSVMQSVAFENNLSETAFVLKRDGYYDLKWFTPETEIDLCGHATLASAFVLMNVVERGLDTVDFMTLSGKLAVRRDGDMYVLDFPSRPASPCPKPEQLEAALGVPVLETYRARDMLALLEDARAVRDLKPDFGLLATISDVFALTVTAKGSDCDFVSRFFAPNAGIPEDPVTGSSHTTLIPFWSKRLGKPALSARQLSRRGGVLACRDLGARVEIGGKAVLYLEGEIRIQPETARRFLLVGSRNDIDNGQAYDWGKVSGDYAKYRDIYPAEFYRRIVGEGLCLTGQTVLDLGTGTGVLPRNLYKYGARFVGTDIAENQIAEARRLSAAAGMDIDYVVSPAEQLDFPDGSFDAVLACMCFFYFDRAVMLPKIEQMLKDGGRFCILYMNWQPDALSIAATSEALVLKYNPHWTGHGMRRVPPDAPEWAKARFDVVSETAYDVDIPFTRESWHGRIRACRGVGASALPAETVARFEKEHLKFLETAPASFAIPHYVTMLHLRKR